MDEAVVSTRDRKIPSILTSNFLRYLFAPPEALVAKYVSPGARAVDLGCGAGFHTFAIGRRVGEKGHVYAVDFDPKAIARLERRLRRRRSDGVIQAQTASASEIDFIESGTIDFVLAEGLLCCMTDHEGAIRQIRRILRPGGRAYLSVIKLANARDPRGISSEEWERLLARFSLLDRGEGLMTRWALVSPAEDAPADPRPAESRAHHLPCC
jgi:SAM-dependent methyltransferase